MILLCQRILKGDLRRFNGAEVNVCLAGYKAKGGAKSLPLSNIIIGLIVVRFFLYLS